MAYQNDRERDVFASFNIKSTESICEVFPPLPGKGTKRNIPTHFLGFSSDFRIAMKKVAEYRNLSGKQKKPSGKCGGE